MARDIYEVPRVRDVLEKVGTGAMIAPAVVEAMGSAVVDRIMGRREIVWPAGKHANTDMEELAEALKGVGDDPGKPALSLVEEKKDEPQQSETVRILVDPAEELSHLTHPYDHHPEHDVAAARGEPRSGDVGVSIQEVGIGSAKLGVAGTRWLAGRTLGALKRPFSRGPHVDTRKLEELGVSPEIHGDVKALAAHLDEPAAFDNLGLVLAHKLKLQMSGEGKEAKPEDVKDRFVKVMSEATPISAGQARFIVNRPGPQSVLR